MPWFRPWILVAFLALVISMLVRGCKETFKYETLTVTAAPNANAHGEHGEVSDNKSEFEQVSIDDIFKAAPGSITDTLKLYVDTNKTKLLSVSFGL